MHWAHRERKDARRSLSEVLGFLTGVRHRSEDLQRAFFSTRFVRVLDRSGYARLKHWKVYAEESLARREVTLWLGPDVLNVEFAGEPLARYDRRRILPADGPPAGGEEAEAVLPSVGRGAVASLRGRRPGRKRVAQGGEVGGVRPQEHAAPAGLAADTIPLRNGPLTPVIGAHRGGSQPPPLRTALSRTSGGRMARR